MKLEKRMANALELAVRFGQIEGDHHKTWVIDQMVRALTGCLMVQRQAVSCNGKPYTFEAMGESEEYVKLVEYAKSGEDGPSTYEWDIGIAP